MSEGRAPKPRWAFAAGVLALLGATLGTLLDAIHTQSGVTAYTYPVFASTAWWVPLLFGAAFTNGLIRPVVDRRPAPSGRTVALAMGFFVLAYACSVIPWSWPAVSALLVAIFAPAFVLCDRTRLGLGIAVVSAIAGPGVEVVLVRAGVFVHTGPAVLGVSGWLPFLYLTAAIALQSLARWLVYGGETGKDAKRG